MEFRIADSFTDSLARLTGDEQKAVKTTAFDLQVNPEQPGLRFHRLDKARDKAFWSVRASREIRLIVHRTDSSLLLCYAGHHDAAYRWAERRRLERHPATGAAQLVEIRETVIDLPVYREVEAKAPSSPTSFAHLSDGELLGYGVPGDWLADVRAATEETILDLAEHLPGEAAEALLELATGGTPLPPVHTTEASDPFEHPDAQRRFRVMTGVAELERALEYPWEKWAVFLHPAQGSIVSRSYNRPARVAGSAGTGKTVVALHRAVELARTHPDAKVLLTTFSSVLARAVASKVDLLAGKEPALRERITVDAIDRVGVRVHETLLGPAQIADTATIRALLKQASSEGEPHRFSDRFLETEWHDVVDAWQLTDWESYRDVARLGRKTRLGEKQRAQLWSIFADVHRELSDRGLMTLPGVFARGRRTVGTGRGAAVRLRRRGRITGYRRAAAALPRGAGRREA